MKFARGIAVAGLALIALTGGMEESARNGVPTTTFTVKGLSDRAEIVVDRWGIPHIYAGSDEDLFFAQGFNAARDRLWQLDLWRRQGEGKLAEAFGPRFVEQDRAARLFLYRGDMDREFASYHPRAREILTAFTRGINAYIELTRTRPELLPLEFKLTGTSPGNWSPTTPLIRIFGLTRNAAREVRLAQLVQALGPEVVARLLGFQPPAELKAPSGLELALIDDRVLGSYNLARAGVRFRAEDFRTPHERAEMERFAQLISVPPSGMQDDRGEPAFESNNWTISGRLTATGKPILAGDPHRAQLVPSLRYIAHLVGPGWNVIGAGEPALPGISLGHNERVAWALTIFSFGDEEDLLVYETNPEKPSQYRYHGQWEEMRAVTETIPVKGGLPVTVTLEFTRHGPVLFSDPEHHKAYALRAAYLEQPGTAAYLASLRLDQARDWSEFIRAAERHYTPSENLVYADVEGNIGWRGCSLVPIRRNWNGLLPVPGDGRYEWDGFLDAGRLPWMKNPKEGFFATANQYNLPDGYPDAGLSSREWADPFRFLRIGEVLGGGRGLTTRDSMRLQYDELSLPARELGPFLGRLKSADQDVAAALKALRGWDFVLSKDSVPAAIYEVWISQLHKNVFGLYVPEGIRAKFGQGSRTVLLQLLRAPDRAFGPDPESGRDAVLVESLAQAIAMLKEKLGPDMTEWKWGKLHHVLYGSTLGPAVDPATKALLDVGPLAVGGDGLTVHATSYRESDFRQTGGATYRQVLDLADWDRSFTLNAPGQSGDPNSPHYRDLFPLAVEGSYVPLLFSRGKIMEAAERMIVLLPETAGQGPGSGRGRQDGGRRGRTGVGPAELTEM